jgi:hypothetical protein
MPTTTLQAIKTSVKSYARISAICKGYGGNETASFAKAI